MHILQLVPRLEVGGVERGVLDLAKGLLARGHRVSVVSAGGPLVEPLTQLGAVHHALPVDEKSLTAVARCVPAVIRIIRETEVDVVHARSRVPGWTGWVAARATQRPFITTAHGFYKPHVASRVMAWGRVVITPSEALADHLVKAFAVPRERLRVIARGVDLEAFTFQPPPAGHEGTWRIGLFGRLSGIKGHAVAIRACERLIRQGLPVKLCIAGGAPDAPLRRQLESLIATLRLQEAVEWLGVRQDMPALLASMDVVVVPSTYPESFGRGVIEAQAVGRPVVASRIGALATLIEDGQTGLLTPPGDDEALAGALRRLFEEPALRQACVRAGREAVEARWPLARMVEETLEVYRDAVERPRVVVWKLAALGDVVLATPSFRAIRQRFPESRLTLVVGRAAFEVVAHCPYFNDVVIFDPGQKDRGWARQWAFVRRLAREGFDVSVDLQNSHRTHLMAWLAGIPARIGYRRKWGGLLNRGVRLPKVVLAPIAHQHHLLREAGVAPAGEQLELWPSSRDVEAAERLVQLPLIDAAPRLVGLHPGGSGRWVTKRWDLDRWVRLCDVLAQRGLRVIVTGGPDERELAEAFTQRPQSRPLVLIGQTSLMELACVIRRCDVFVAHDSSPLHLAAAVGTPTVALFGPTDPARHLPPAFTGRVLKKDVFCSPCYAPTCRTITHACMKRIEFEEVLDAVLALLDAPRSRPPLAAPRGAPRAPQAA